MKKNILMFAIGAIVVIGIIVLLMYLKSVNDYKQEVANLKIHDIDLSETLDGTYAGDCNVDFIYAKVEVTVKDHTITDIKLIQHKNGKGKPAEKLVDTIIEEQSVQVDTVSGATNSSKVIMKAVENALSNGRMN